MEGATRKGLQEPIYKYEIVGLKYSDIDVFTKK